MCLEFYSRELSNKHPVGNSWIVLVSACPLSVRKVQLRCVRHTKRGRHTQRLRCSQFLSGLDEYLALTSLTGRRSESHRVHQATLKQAHMRTLVKEDNVPNVLCCRIAILVWGEVAWKHPEIVSDSVSTSCGGAASYIYIYILIHSLRCLFFAKLYAKHAG